jgi:membrane protein
VRPKFQRAWTVLRAIVHEIRTEKVTFLAGSIAYHAFVSILPLLLLLVLLLSALGDVAPTEAVFTLVSAAFTDNAADLLVGELRRTSRSRELSVVGGAVLVWGTLRVFRGIDTAFSDIYETEGNNTFLDQLGDGILVFVAFALAVVVAGALHSTLPTDGGGLWRVLLGRGLLALGLTVTLFPMYYVFPDTDVSVREVLPGTVFAGVGLAAFESLFRVYLGWSGKQPDESVLAAILVFLTWLYVSGFVVLIGAAVNAVLSNRSADVSIEPVIGGVADGETRSNRDELLADLDEVERLFEDPDSVTVNASEGSVNLPAPQSVSVERGNSFLDSTVSVEFRWSPAAGDDSVESGDSVAGDDADEMTDADEVPAADKVTAADTVTDRPRRD